jgi:hypothetical protein
MAIARPTNVDEYDEFINEHHKRKLSEAYNAIRKRVEELENELMMHKKMLGHIEMDLSPYQYRASDINTQQSSSKAYYDYYVYQHVRSSGPTQCELCQNPSLRDAWEQYLIIRRISQ